MSATPFGLSPHKPVEVEMALPMDEEVGPEAIGAAQIAATGRRGKLKPVFIIGTTILFIFIATGVAVGVNSSRNKRAALTSNPSVTTFEKSYLVIGPQTKKLTSSSRDPSLLCGCQECEDVKDNTACGVIEDNCHTCEARIDYLQTSGSLTEDEACRLVGKDEFKSVCGPCYKCKSHKSAPDATPIFWCNNPQCTDTIFNVDNAACDTGGCHTCKARVEYLESSEFLDENEACNKVTEEFPIVCPCGW